MFPPLLYPIHIPMWAIRLQAKSFRGVALFRRPVVGPLQPFMLLRRQCANRQVVTIDVYRFDLFGHFQKRKSYRHAAYIEDGCPIRCPNRLAIAISLRHFSLVQFRTPHTNVRWSQHDTVTASYERLKEDIGHVWRIFRVGSGQRTTLAVSLECVRGEQGKAAFMRRALEMQLGSNPRAVPTSASHETSRGSRSRLTASIQASSTKKSASTACSGSAATCLIGGYQATKQRRHTR